MGFWYLKERFNVSCTRSLETTKGRPGKFKPHFIKGWASFRVGDFPLHTKTFDLKAEREAVAEVTQQFHRKDLNVLLNHPDPTAEVLARNIFWLLSVHNSTNSKVISVCVEDPNLREVIYHE